MKRYVYILRSKWKIEEKSAAEEKRLENSDGFCDWTERRIVVQRETEGNLGDMERYIRKVMRHEIIHAFLFECGLAWNTADGEPWAQNEEMVDWLAYIGPRIYAAWEQAGALDE